VSVSPSLAASSILSWTLRYFCLSNVFSRELSWWSVKAVRALRGFLGFNRCDGLSCPDALLSDLAESRDGTIISCNDK